MKVALMMFMFATLAPTSGFAGCKVDQLRWSWGQDTSTVAHVTDGGRCKITFSTGRGSGMSSIAITEKAKHGSATTNGSVAYPEVVYVPSRGFKGADEFVFTVTGGSARSTGASNIRVSVDSR